MKHAINIAGYLLILAGCTFTAWSTYFILSATYITLWASGASGFAAEPRIIITSPATDVVSRPTIRVTGCFPTEIKTVTYDITNAVGTNLNLAKSELTANGFQLNDVQLAKGKNRIIVHVRDTRGKQYSMRQSVTLVGAGDETPPVDADSVRQ